MDVSGKYESLQDTVMKKSQLTYRAREIRFVEQLQELSCEQVELASPDK